jgi:acetylornithine deacetylase/succinyl-diaminopimelate desuccinylase-like protein
MRRSRALAAIVVLLLAAVAGLIAYNRHLKTDVDSQLYIPGSSRMTPEIALLQQYVRIDTSNPPGNETAGARFLAGILEKNGVRAEVIESAPGRGSVYARIKGKQPGQGLLLLSHIDVVPAAPGGWTRPPFAAAVFLNMLWGRGALDMKGVGICELEGFLDVAGSGRVPERDIAFLAVADEEERGHMGTEWLLAHRPDLFEGMKYVLNEGGITETRRSEVSYVGIEIGTKLEVEVRLRAPGRAGMQRIRVALEPYMTPRDPERISPEVRLYFHEIAPLRTSEGRLLDNIDDSIARGKFWLLDRGYHELVQNVLWLDGVREDEHGATMTVKLLDLPDEDPDARIAWLRKTIEPMGGTIEQIVEKSGPAPYSPLNTPLFHLLEREFHRHLGNVPVGPQILAASSNDSRYLRARGMIAYGIWPFAVDFYQSTGIHSVDERVRLDWFMDGVDVSRRVVAGWAFEPQPGG